MTTTQTDSPTPQKPLRLWPGVAAALLILVAMFGIPIFAPEAMIFGMLGGVACGLIVFIWWLFFSRAPWFDRVLAIVVMVAGMFITRRLVDPSISNAGMGMMFPIFGIPVLGLALVAWAAASRRFAAGLRRATMVAAILLACGTFTLVRTGGITGGGKSDLHWRWTPTPEELLLAQARNEPTAPPHVPAPAPAPAEAPKQQPLAQAGDKPAAPATAETSKEQPSPRISDKPAPAAPIPVQPNVETGAGWPGFRGPNRDSIISGVQIKTDWSASPPVQLWKKPVGPGWSSFAVHGDLLYTQEQRGDDEIVSCYRVSTGEPVWRHRDAARFWESNAGPGPRATPTLSNGRVYTFGATGILNALDAATGAAAWSRNAATDTGKKVPTWGFAGSPLVVGDQVVVAVAGMLIAYDIATGHPRWMGPKGGGGYSSPQLLTIDGVAQIVLLTGAGATSVAPANGTVLWEAKWEGDGIVQPGLTAEGDVLLGSGSGNSQVGMHRVAVKHGSAGWNVEDRWTTTALKPYFNDFVVHKGYAFGFDGGILACINLADGQRKWKGGRYGHGQLVLLPDQDLLLVLSEEGELVLVSAKPDQFTELAKVPAIEGKTWNHPVLVGDLLLVRNDQEMAAFRLSLAGR